TETLADTGDARQDLARDHDGLAHRLQLAKAVIASAAVFPGVLLAEVRDEMPMPAADAGGVALHVAQQRAPRVVQLAIALEHHAPLQEVGARIHEDALRFEAVAPGASRLLLVVLQRLRRARVDDEAHVGS